MTRLIFANIFRFIILIVLQVLISNFVYLGGYVIPFVYILAVLMLPSNLGKIPLLLISFAAGMLVDVFCVIPGFHAFSCTMLAFFRIVLGNRILTQNEPEAVVTTPSIHEVPFQTFSVYAIIMSAVYCIAYGLVEVFNFGNFGMTLLSMAINTMVAWIMIMLSQFLVTKPR